jgi:hypothetical protein
MFLWVVEMGIKSFSQFVGSKVGSGPGSWGGPGGGFYAKSGSPVGGYYSAYNVPAAAFAQGAAEQAAATRSLAGALKGGVGGLAVLGVTYVAGELIKAALQTGKTPNGSGGKQGIAGKRYGFQMRPEIEISGTFRGFYFRGPYSWSNNGDEFGGVGGARYQPFFFSGYNDQRPSEVFEVSYSYAIPGYPTINEVNEAGSPIGSPLSQGIVLPASNPIDNALAEGLPGYDPASAAAAANAALAAAGISAGSSAATGAQVAAALLQAGQDAAGKATKALTLPNIAVASSLRT